MSHTNFAIGIDLIRFDDALKRREEAGVDPWFGNDVG
jgi:hypothetical protein